MNDEKNATDQLTEAVDNLVAAINETPPFNWIGAAIEWLVDKLAAILERGPEKEKIMDDAKITVPGISAAEATENIRKNMELLDRPPLSERTREEFRRIFNDKIGLRRREGAEKLLDWMERNGFFEAPASTKHHLAIPGGLALHSLNVYHRLEEILEREKENEQIFSLAEIEESMAIMALLHDICKTDCYHRDPETGAYTFRDPLPWATGKRACTSSPDIWNCTPPRPWPSGGIWGPMTTP